MPFYEYECSNCGQHQEVLQQISDAPLKKCPNCGKNALRKLVSAPVFRLKGSGWYETDFKSDQENKRNLAGSDPEEAKSESKSDAKPDEKGGTKDGAKDSTKEGAKEGAKEGGKNEGAKPESARAGKPASTPVRPVKRAKPKPAKPKPAKKKGRR